MLHLAQTLTQRLWQWCFAGLASGSKQHHEQPTNASLIISACNTAEPGKALSWCGLARHFFGCCYVRNYTVQDYEALPVEEFGKALLRGLGWLDGEGVGKKRQLVEPKQIVRRPDRLGLGANPAAPPPEKRPRKMGELQLCLVCIAMA